MKQTDKKGLKNKIGAFGEQIAVNYLKNKGFSILDTNYLKKWGDRYDYNLACEILEASGLLYDDGYKYGSAWLFRPVPQTAIKWLEALPDDTDKLLSVAPVWAK